MRRAIHEFQDAGVEPDVWKLEGLGRKADCEGVAATARRGDAIRPAAWSSARARMRPRSMLATAADVPAFIGFAVGQSWDPLVALRDGTLTHEAAVAAVARRFR